jgi:hypothetical protein
MKANSKFRDRPFRVMERATRLRRLMRFYTFPPFARIALISPRLRIW